MTVYKITPRPFPAPPYTCELVELRLEVLPFVLSALRVKAEKYHWQTTEDWVKARQSIAYQGAQLLMGCKDEIITAINQLYRLQDTVYNGAVYTVAGAGTVEDPYVYNPPIPLVPPVVNGAEPSIKFSLEKSMRLIDNLVNATTYTDAPDNRNVRQQLEDLIAAVQAQGGLDEDMLAQLVQIVGLLA